MISSGLTVAASWRISALVAEPSLIQLSGAAAPAGSTEKPAPTLATYRVPDDRSFSLSATNTK